VQRVLSRNGIDLQFAAVNPATELPSAVQQFVVTRFEGGQSWHVGRAGMLYRDLIPSRMGGRFIASHIRIPDGGQVPDYVHYHRIRFQMIYCRSGWARLVYEDQGEPFLFSAGDCVLQPPEIRHRVLETSAGFEVIEVSCPAVHATHADHRLELPTGRTLPDRLYGSQRFVRHVAADARWSPWSPTGGHASGFEARDTGIARATNGLAGASVVRCTHDGASTAVIRYAGEFLLLFVLHGVLALRSDRLGDHRLAEADCCVIPAPTDYAVTGDRGLEMLEVRLPGDAGDAE
jgi:mannose-6-phosphate isomerase-like protein (cupin superfamily)